MGREYIYERNDFECNVVKEVGNFLHLHNEIELMYIYKGKIKVSCNFQEYTVKEGEMIIIFPNTMHAVEKLEDTEYLLSIFSKDIFSTLAPILATQSIVGSPVISKGDLHEEVSFALEQIYKRIDIQVKCNISIAYLMIILENILGTVALEPFHYDKNIEWLYEVVKFLNENYKQKITLDEISHRLGISKYHLSRNFNSRIGCSISEYVNRLRVNWEKNLIENTDLSVTSIAMECGFESLTSFFRAFKQLEHKSPKKYREEFIINKHINE